ncbi:hypothetical protein C7M61_004836 [Candidozyma pseudohaemuli]|uniref:Origin recognition complex subunit 1 n=1 Tax=Candidozyma pseudohaemuli TaxID=418784 RepID=A0A2P7YGS3_9ASCO|nr:hypothetical protein C7M61_004836 [[Candida] pseudohaemulonii]PSK35172.1 hypothetical protein C7M61_004836 [[Candida] pseudohaemulonii]
MAKRQKDLGDWKIVLEEPENDSSNSPATPSRRSRRRAESTEPNSVKLQREEDDLVIQAGDCLLISDVRPSYYIITSIQLGLKSFVELWGARFITKDQIDQETLEGVEVAENEVFITPEISSLKVNDVVQKIQVLDSTAFADIVLDDSSISLTYLCRRACNSQGDNVSKEFNFSELRSLVVKDHASAIRYISENTLVIISPKKRKLKTSSLTERLMNSDSPRRRTYTESPSEDSDSDDFVKQESEDEESEDLDLDLEPEVAEPSEPKPTKKRKASTPKKEASESPRKRATAARGNERSNLQNVLSPLKKGFKVKTGTSVGSLPSLNRKSTKQSQNVVDTSSEAFKELKKKLHTSTTITSLPRREDEWVAVYTNLEDAIQTQTGSCVYVSGTPGVGKTATIKEVIRSLQSSVADGLLNEFDFLDINCLKLLSPESAYEKLWEFVSGIKVTPANAALLLDDYFGKDDTEEPRRPLVVLLDELDQIVTKTQSVMYNFFNWPTYANSKLIIIAVANTMDLPERVLTNKISSRLGLRRIQFVGYTFDDLGEIIANRLTMLSEEHKRKVQVSKDAVGFASRKVASVSGDARRALTICRRAVEIAEQEFLETETDLEKPESEQTFTIQIGHISKAINETINSPIAQLLNLLSFESKLVLVGILLRMRRSGLAENSLGDVMDEMKNSLDLLTSKDSSNPFKKIESHDSFADFCYGNPRNIRVYEMARLVNQMEELGIIAQQNLRSERYRLIQLNISEDEVLAALRRDQAILPML